jgi:predicted phosphodiesterase
MSNAPRALIQSIRLALLFCCCLCVTAQHEKPFFFLQFSDPQFGMYAKDADFQHEQANFEFVIASANRLRPAFIVVCGDLINRPGDAAQAEAYLSIAHKVAAGIPVYNIAGNHDVGNIPSVQLLALYRERFGKDYYTFDVGSLRGIVLNSSLIMSPAGAPAETEAQEKWLIGELQRGAREHVGHLVIFQHIPYFLERPDEPDQYFNIPSETRKRYLALFHQYGVSHVFAGHYHRNAYGHDGALEAITTGPVGMPLGKDQSGIRAVVVEAGGIRHKYYEFGEIPQAIDPLQPLPQRP